MRVLLIAAILLTIITNVRAAEIAIAVNKAEAQIIQIENLQEEA